MEIRSADGTQDPELTWAIGSTVRASAGVSRMIQQLAATITGSELVPFLFDDKTLGTQRDALESLVMATNWNPYAPHPAVTDEDRKTVLDILTECRQLIVYRNRVAHDEWAVWPTPEVPDAVEGDRPARWAKSTVHSSIRSLRILANHLGLAASALSAMEEKIIAERSGPGRRLIGGSTPERFLQACADRKQGRLDDWRWIDLPSKYRPQRENVPIELSPDHPLFTDPGLT